MTRDGKQSKIVGVLGVCGVCVLGGLAGCSGYGWSQPTMRAASPGGGPVRVAQPVQYSRGVTDKTRIPVTDVRTTRAARAHGGGSVTLTATPARTTPDSVVQHGRTKKMFDPFWLERDAENALGSVGVEDPRRPLRGSTPMHRPRREVRSDPRVDRPSITKESASLWPTVGYPHGATLSDGMEGLMHVTFAGEGADFDPDVSRDGSMIVYASTQHRKTADIYLKRTDGRTVTQLTADPGQDVMPSFSPDGSRIAFASNRDGNWDIYVMGTGGGRAVKLTGTPQHDVHPTWSSDGKKLVFSRLGEMSGRWEMWVIEVDRPQLAEFVGFGLFPEFCPVPATGPMGGDMIVYQRSRDRGDRAFSIWTIEYSPGDASSPTEIASSMESALINPSWSPTGDWIVYASITSPELLGRDPRGPVNADLWMTDLRGAGKVNLTSGQFMNLMPSWSDDGRIYFVSDRSGVNNLWSIRTRRAIFAATGKMPESNTDFATVPTDGDTGD